MKVIEDGGLSEDNATELIKLFKKICFKIYGEQIPLPSVYRSVKRTVLETIEYRILPINKLEIKYPKEMFDTHSNRLTPMTCCYLDPLAVIAEKLCSPGIQGKYYIIYRLVL